MSDEPEDTEVKAVAKAVEETAKAVQVVTPEVAKMATYLARLVGTVPEDFIDIILGQPLHHLRARTGIWWAERTYEYVKKRRVEHAKKVSPKGAISVFEAATEETDETILDLWARLMASAMDPERDTSLSKQLIEVLREFEPDDVLVFESICETFYSFSEDSVRASYFLKQAGAELDKLGWRETRVLLSRERLARFGVIERTNTYPTALGKELWHAVSDDGPA